MMDERKEFEELKRMLKEQGDQVAETMATMKVKASALEEKLAKRAELSSANAEAGAKKIALEYKVVELEIRHDFPPGVSETPKTPPTGRHSDGVPFTFGASRASPGVRFTNDPSIGHQPTAEADQPDDQTVAKECEEKALQKYREFEDTRLKELGEEGWTLRSIARGGISGGAGYTNLYYFSRPL